jgi:hypothetical protein
MHPVEDVLAEGRADERSRPKGTEAGVIGHGEEEGFPR